MSTLPTPLFSRDYATVTGPDGTIRYTPVWTVPYNPAMPYHWSPVSTNNGLSNGQIAGIVVSSLALTILIPYVGWVVYKHRQHKNMGQYPEPVAKGPGKLAALMGMFKKRAGGQGDLEKGASGRSTPIGGGHLGHPGADETVISDHHGDGSMRGSATHLSA